MREQSCDSPNLTNTPFRLSFFFFFCRNVPFWSDIYRFSLPLHGQHTGERTEIKPDEQPSQNHIGPAEILYLWWGSVACGGGGGVVADKTGGAVFNPARKSGDQPFAHEQNPVSQKLWMLSFSLFCSWLCVMIVNVGKCGCGHSSPTHLFGWGVSANQTNWLKGQGGVKGRMVISRGDWTWGCIKSQPVRKFLHAVGLKVLRHTTTAYWKTVVLGCFFLLLLRINRCFK